MAAALAASFLVLAIAPPASAQDEFYSGKTIQLLIGFSAGGGYDIYGRTLGRYLGRHIPGHPQIVPQNMPGAGSLKLANYLYNVAPKDGSVFGTFSRSMGISPLIDKAEFDSRKFSWLGSITSAISSSSYARCQTTGSTCPSAAVSAWRASANWLQARWSSGWPIQM